jgi:hypothetical protein
MSALLFVFGVIASSFFVATTINSPNDANAAIDSKAACESVGGTWVPTGPGNYSAPYCSGKAACATGGGIWSEGDKSCTYVSSPSLSAKMQGLGAENRAKSYAYYKAVWECVDGYLKNDNIYADIDFDGLKTSPTNGYWYGDGKSSADDRWEGWSRKLAKVTYLGNTESGCSKLTNDALTLWDIGTPADMLKAMNYEYDAGNSSPQWKYKGDKNGNKAAQFKRWLESKGVSTSNSGEARYYLTKTAFSSFCQPKNLGAYASTSNSRKQQIDNYNINSGKTPALSKVTELSGSTALVTNAYEYQFGMDSGGRLDNMWPIVEDDSYDNDDVAKRCVDMPSAISSNASSFLNGLLEDACRKEKFTTPNDLKACKAGIQMAGNADFCKLAFSDANQQNVCLQSQGVSPAETTDPGEQVGTGENDKSSCVVEGIGWIVCPVINFLANVADSAFGFLADTFLRTDPTAFKTDGPAYEAWVIMRNVANVLFVIAFLIIIFSQLTGAGITNYGVKKMLPRLVIAAILVNVSFIISQLAVDLSNILGYSIRDVFDGVSNQIRGETYNDVASTAAVGSSFSDIAIGILAFSGAALALYAMLSTFGAVILAAVIALLMILFILIARQAIVVLLVVLSPIAFVALLLPNTENLFKFWRKTLTAMLMLFPIIALVFGASTLASTVLQGSFTGAYNGEGSNWFGQIVASAILVLPLFVVPYVLKKALDGVPMLGQMANKWSGRANANLAKKTGASYQGSRFALGKRFREQRRATNRTLAMGGEYNGKNPLLKAQSAINSRLNSSPTSGQFGDRLAAQGIALANKEEAESISAMEQQIRRASVSDPGAAQAMLAKALKSGDTVRAKAAQNVMFTQGSGAVGKFFDTVQSAQGGQHSSEVMSALRENINTNHGQYVKSKAADISKWAALGGKIDDASHKGALSGMSEAELAGQTSATLERAKSSINASTAQSLLNNKQLSGNLDADQLKVLREAASGGTATGAGTATGTGTATAAATATPAAQQAGVQPATQQQNALSAAQRARQTADQAAQGTSGDGVFVVSHTEGTTRSEQPAQATPPSTTAGQATTTTNEHGQMGIAGQHEDTIDRMSR